MGYGTMKNNNILEMALDRQKKHGYVTENDICEIAAEVGRPAARIYETLSFYSMILLKKPAALRIEVCRGTSCCIAGGIDILARIKELTGCSVGECSEDGRYEVAYCECLGHCETAPNLLVNGKLYTSVTEDMVESIVKEVSF